MNYQKFETIVGGKTISVEIGKLCMQASGSCIVSCGETMVMVNVCMAKEKRAGIDFFPLGVDYEEKMYAVGKIPGGFKRREGRASDKAILTSRLIDRPLRPLFPKGFYNDVSVVVTPLSVDPDISPEPLGMLGSSIALSIANIPFAGPTGSVLVGLVDGEYIVNPNLEQREKSVLHLTVSGTEDAVLMVEAGAKEVSEEEMLKGIFFAHEEIKKLVKWQKEIVETLGIKKSDDFEIYHVPEDIDEIVRKYATEKMEQVLTHFDRTERENEEEKLNEEVFAYIVETYGEEFLEEHKNDIVQSLYYLKKEKVRANIIDKGVRPDGRKLTEIRPIWCEVGMLPRVHGSGVFTRGLTQVMTTCTLGTIGDMQKLEGLDDEELKRYMHHYNMPPYTVGEARPMKAPGRREIGHGALAERALEPVLPSEEEFPYAIRTVSEVLSSNGSTSQASVCGSTLALMDAGVPISAPVAGIAMGLIKDEAKNKVAVLSDIQGLEDFLGDMDFKVAGTTKGITAIQMDIKIKGITDEILTQALAQAKEGRMHILGKMLEALDAPRKELSKYAPKIISFPINPNKIKDVIGSGGKMINKIIEETGVKIDITEEGIVMIATTDAEMAQKAKEIILGIAEDLEVGKQYTGTVEKILQFGAIVEFPGGKSGMIHISKLSSKKVAKVEDVVIEGDQVVVEVIKIDPKQNKTDLKLIEKL